MHLEVQLIHIYILFRFLELLSARQTYILSSRVERWHQRRFMLVLHLCLMLWGKFI